MSTLPSRRILHTLGWLMLAIAVAGVVRISGRSEVTPPVEPAEEARPLKSRDRDIRQLDETRSPLETVERLMARPPGIERDQSLRQAVGTWADNDPDSALSWVDRLSPGEERDWLASAVLTSMANNNPGSAAALLDRELPPGKPRNHALVAIAQRWVQTAPEKAREWVESLDHSTAKDDAMQELQAIGAALCGPLAEE